MGKRTGGEDPRCWMFFLLLNNLSNYFFPISLIPKQQNILSLSLSFFCQYTESAFRDPIITDGLWDCLLFLPTNFLLVNSYIIFENRKITKEKPSWLLLSDESMPGEVFSFLFLKRSFRNQIEIRNFVQGSKGHDECSNPEWRAGKNQLKYCESVANIY